MEEKQLLELILSKLTSIESEITGIKSVQAQHTQQLDIIREQTAKNAELESVVDELAKDMQKLKDDNVLIKRVLAN